MTDYPESASVRYVAAAIVTAAIALGVVLGLAGLVTTPWLYAGFLSPLGYVAGVLAASVPMGRRLEWRSRLWLPVVIVTMHLSWGWGFLRSISRAQRR